MNLGTLHDKIGCRLGRPTDLRPHPGVAGRERAVSQSGPIGADRSVERLAARQIAAIINLADPLYIRPEPRLTRKIKGDMDTETARRRDGVDKPAKRSAPDDGKIYAPAKEGGRDRFSRDSQDGVGESGRVEPGCVDQNAAANLARLLAADAQMETVVVYSTAQHRRAITKAPAASASPSRASINAWLSMMPVDGDSKAATQRTSGSSRCA